MTDQTRPQSEDRTQENTYSGAHILALAAGELHGAAVRRYLEDFHEADGNTVHHIQLTFERLLHVGVLRKNEVVRLKEILTLLNNREASSAEAMKVVRNVLNSLVDEEASPCAVALASIAENSVGLAIASSAKSKVNWWHVLGEDLAGAGAGALAGATVAGVGAGLGAVCGAAVASGKALAAS